MYKRGFLILATFWFWCSKKKSIHLLKVLIADTAFLIYTGVYYECFIKILK